MKKVICVFVCAIMAISFVSCNETHKKTGNEKVVTSANTDRTAESSMLNTTKNCDFSKKTTVKISNDETNKQNYPEMAYIYYRTKKYDISYNKQLVKKLYDIIFDNLKSAGDATVSEMIGQKYDYTLNNTCVEFVYNSIQESVYNKSLKKNLVSKHKKLMVALENEAISGSGVSGLDIVTNRTKSNKYNYDVNINIESFPCSDLKKLIKENLSLDFQNEKFPHVFSVNSAKINNNGETKLLNEKARAGAVKAINNLFECNPACILNQMGIAGNSNYFDTYKVKDNVLLLVTRAKSYCWNYDEFIIDFNNYEIRAPYVLYKINKKTNGKDTLSSLKKAVGYSG